MHASNSTSALLFFASLSVALPACSEDGESESRVRVAFDEVFVEAEADSEAIHAELMRPGQDAPLAELDVRGREGGYFVIDGGLPRRVGPRMALNGPEDVTPTDWAFRLFTLWTAHTQAPDPGPATFSESERKCVTLEKVPPVTSGSSICYRYNEICCKPAFPDCEPGWYGLYTQESEVVREFYNCYPGDEGGGGDGGPSGCGCSGYCGNSCCE
ncbi:MAG: hypothetical protein IPH07_37410 [Deltaproteobacteria bacterium]|nr:hypothetical protein [Deltaproteobacteria bacterium]MBK8713504.1 hypothetical protein [Deltaproteobacteria bacterium]MBP7289956.1 hypothetical protein [Nannocystaceae bacterium]